MATAPEKREESGRFGLTLSLTEGYEFTVDFDQPGIPELVVDEHPPVGAGRGPSPSKMLATAVGHCLASSFLFCVRKSRVDVKAFAVRVEGTTVRNQRGRLRIGGLTARLAPEVRPEDRERLSRCLELFEDFCIITQSVREGLKVDVEVVPQP